MDLMKKTLIIGFGNLDREDDGVAWHILDRFSRPFNFHLDPSPEEIPLPLAENLDILFLMQLMPELAEMIAGYDRVCFVDAHTGAVPEELHISAVGACFQNSPLTHHMTPETVMCLTRDIYNATPEAKLVSVRGYQFEFRPDLSARTDQLANLAVKEIQDWIEK
jgi:hydrogenase maturation protease